MALPFQAQYMAFYVVACARAFPMMFSVLVTGISSVR